MTFKIQFFGAAGTVTGSKYLVTAGNKRILVDVGLFQGKREWREKNWNNPLFYARDIDAVLLTHAHIDHTGMLPRFGALGLKAPIYCTEATAALCRILLPDSARLQEEEASWRNKKGKSKHSPALALYTEEDANNILKYFKEVPFYKDIEILPGITARWSRMGHIIGAASINLTYGNKTITFSGDIGRYNAPILVDPEPVELGDLLLIESTYGDRLHADSDPKQELAKQINETTNRGGVVIIPSFAVGRAQQLLFYLRELKEKKIIADIPIIIDSPMAKSATSIYREHLQDYDKESLKITAKGGEPFMPTKTYFTESQEESRELNSISDPMIIISASGMLSGGRILHHLKHRVSSPLNRVIFVGYQPSGGRGDWMLSGAKSMRLLGEEVAIRATVSSISGLSAHGDREEMLRWCRSCGGLPKQVAVVHGEPESAATFAKELTEQMKWDAVVPSLNQVIIV